ncbi:MAG: extracellular solute-binding protein [Propionibacteriaceae bacterium]|nr:extracellular solute-binding protein [Propionibacteriaceae bacterium]
MQIRTKRFAGVLGGAAALALIAGCAGGTTPPAATTAPTATDTPAASAPAAEAVTIEYIHRLPDGEGMTKVAELADEWNKANPDIQVTTTKFDGKAADLVTKIEADVAAGTAACLAQAGYAEVPSLFTKGLVEDVTAEAEKYKANYSDGAYTLMTVGGKAVGLPQDGGPLVYYYNKAEFDRLGLTVPTNLDEFKATAKTAADQGKFIAAFQPDEAQYWLSAQAAAAGGTWYSAENDQWKVDADGEASQTVAAFWQEMIDAKTVAVHNRWEDGFKGALNDQSLIGTIGAAWEAPLLVGDMADSPNVGQWAVAQLPAYGDTAMTGPDGGSGVVVLKGCEHPAEAMKFNDWFNTQIDGLVSQGLVVAAKGSMTTPEDVKAFYGGQDVFAELAKANEALNPNFPYIPTFPAIGGNMAEAADNAGQGSGKVADVFTAAQDASVKSLQDAGLPVAG